MSVQTLLLIRCGDDLYHACVFQCETTDKYNSSLEDATKLKFVAPQIPFPMKLFLAKVKIFIFSPITMDYI